jgi:hypothetical protein
MAILPTAQMLPTEQTVAPHYPNQVPGNLLTPVPHAIGSLGEALMNMGAAAEAQQKQGKDYDLLKRFNDFKAARDKDYQDAQEALDPKADPAGFAEGINKNFEVNAREFFQTVPEYEKPKYNLSLSLMHDKQVLGAAADEQKHRENYFTNDAEERLSGYKLKIAQDPAKHAEIVPQAKAEIDAIPLPPVKKQKLYAGLGDLDEAATLHRLRQGDDPEEVLKDLQVQSPAKAAATGEPLDISWVLETGAKSPLAGLGNISSDTNSSRSYGNFGLNSQKGASAWEFKSKYGAGLGLTAEPGTSEFDRQWKAAAEKNPEALHAAETDWWRNSIATKVGDRLSAAGAGQLASDPRVLTYFADREVQQGAGSTGNHSTRIQEAVRAADGDPVKFLKNMSEIDKEKLGGDFRTYLKQNPGNGEGLENRVDQRLKLSLQAGEAAARNPDDPIPVKTEVYRTPRAELEKSGYIPPGTDGSDPGSKMPGQEDQPQAQPVQDKYPNLSMDRRTKLIQVVTDAARQKRTQELDSSLEVIRQTGEPPVFDGGMTALDRAKKSQSFTPKQLEAYNQKWDAAQLEHKMIGGLDEMTPDQMGQHLEQFTPDPKSSGYKSMIDAQKRAETQQNKILSMRDKDPALAVNGFGEVQQAYREMENRKQPITKIAGVDVEQPVISSQDAWKSVISARLAAQERVGIPEPARSPVTEKEAQDLLGLGKNPDAVLAVDPNKATTHLKEAAARAQLLYGPEYGSQAFRSAIRFLVKGQTARDTAVGMISKISRGEALTASDAALYEQEKTFMPMRQFGQLLGAEQGLNAGDLPGAEPYSGWGGRNGNLARDGREQVMDPRFNPPASMRASTPLPTRDQIKMIQDHPENWREVDAVFGPGTAARAMQTDVNEKPKKAESKPWSISKLWGGE